MLYDFLNTFDGISFHMPGHKGKIPFKIKDITEIAGSDNLRCPSGVIKESQNHMAKLLGREHALFLTDGASAGITASIFAFTNENDTVLIDRNCHVSVINGLILSGAMPKYMYPEINQDFGIPKPISNIDYVSQTMTIITSPTYYGDVCDIKAIKEACKNSILLADEAHGAHYYFSDRLQAPTHADISVIGFHKTMPSLTQAAVLTFNKNYDKLKDAVHILTTTSPSYPIMASLDYAARHGKSVYNSEIDAQISELRHLDLKIHPNNDFYKLLINFEDAALVHETLIKEYNIYPEGVFNDNILFMISPYNTIEELTLLKQALKRFKRSDKKYAIEIPRLQTVVSPRTAYFAQGETVERKNAKGRIAKENIIKFPPCVPIVTMGEKMTEEILELIDQPYIEVLK